MEHQPVGSVPPTTLAGGRQKGQVVRERAIAAAAVRLADTGYEGCSLEDIAREAQLTKNQLMHHFGSKEALVLAAVDRAWALWQREVITPSEVYPDARGQLEFIFGRLGELMAEGWPQLRVLGHLAAGQAALPPTVRARMGEGLQAMGERLRGLFKDLRRSSQILPEHKARALSEFALAAMLGAALLYDAREGGGQSQALLVLRSVICGEGQQKAVDAAAMDGS